uniref:GB1/RHD3-type G domain-containing protein n=1 Tax=Pelusios castaneus TaxID=367368 RepID=A0A8C8VPI3_9SAUR
MKTINLVQPLIPMPAPICLMENSPAGELQVQQEALRVLEEITQPVVVVAIAGLYRTGKSYLMNKLASRRTGFSLGSTVQSHTKGIWMWCVPHPCRAGHTLVLLDTEGLGDVEKGNVKNDTWIFALAVLLSSTLVYNSMNTIDHYALEKLHYVTELTEHIKVKAAGEGGRQEEEDSAEFVRFFPAFVWAVRDFTLQLKLNGREISEDEYLEHALKLKPGHGKEVAVYNTTRDCLRNYFPTRKCFVFMPPVPGEQMSQLAALPDSALHPQFLVQTSRFCEYVFQESQVKTIPGGQPVNARLFGSLVQTYVSTIQSGQVPCPENAVTTMATIENEAAVKEALAHYTAGMAAQQLPAELGELSEAHGKCEGEALALFMQRSFKDEDRAFQKRLMVAIKERYVKLLGENEAASKDSCCALLEELSAAMQQKLSDGVYSQAGGYEVYLRDRCHVVEDFRKAEAVLEQFLASKRTEAQTVSLYFSLSFLPKEEKQKAEMLEQQQKVVEEKQLQMEQLMKDQERSHQEHVRQLEAKVTEEVASAQQEAKRALECKLKEHEAMLQQGFKEKSQTGTQKSITTEAQEKKQNAVGHQLQPPSQTSSTHHQRSTAYSTR